jgi:hypothetical protein
MKSYDNHGRLVSEINTSYTRDGKVITTNTVYNTYNGQPAYQDISIRDTHGKITTEHVIGGKLLP